MSLRFQFLPCRGSRPTPIPDPSSLQGEGRFAVDRQMKVA
jgi:hypothetical protein